MSKKTVKVLLKKDILNFGHVGEIKTAALGFARNFILPQGFGSIATPEIVAAHEASLKNEKDSQAKSTASAKTTADKLTGKVITLRVKAGEKGKLFGSVTRDDVAQALKDQHSVKVDAKAVLLDQPIKTLGKHQVNVAFGSKVTSAVTIQIVSAKS